MSRISFSLPLPSPTVSAHTNTKKGHLRFIPPLYLRSVLLPLLQFGLIAFFALPRPLVALRWRVRRAVRSRWFDLYVFEESGAALLRGVRGADPQRSSVVYGHVGIKNSQQQPLRMSSPLPQASSSGCRRCRFLLLLYRTCFCGLATRYLRSSTRLAARATEFRYYFSCKTPFFLNMYETFVHAVGGP